MKTAKELFGELNLMFSDVNCPSWIIVSKLKECIIAVETESFFEARKPK